MKIVKKILKWIGIVMIIPVLYIVVSLILTFITVDRLSNNKVTDHSIFLSTNGVHLGIVIPKESIDDTLLSSLKHNDSDKYLTFGWGDENFYLNTPTWADLTFKNAFRAVFLKSSTLMHVTQFKQRQTDWVEIKVTTDELKKVNKYILNSFALNKSGIKVMLEDKGYTSTDNFYKAKGSYSALNTCNTWANTAFKQSGLKASLWTPFDFGLINKYEATDNN